MGETDETLLDGYIDGPGVDIEGTSTAALVEETMSLISSICERASTAVAAEVQIDNRTCQLVAESVVETLDKLLDTVLVLASHSDSSSKPRKSSGAWMTVTSALRAMGPRFSALADSVTPIMELLFADPATLQPLRQPAGVSRKRKRAH